MLEKINKRTGITLIALVVTIVILLILAGVSISMLTGENGVISQAQTAKLESRAGEVEEKVGLWKTDNNIRKNNNQTLVSKEEMLNNLKTEGIVYENEIDRQNEIIRIGTHEISYGIQISININISKTPETELSNAVLLQVVSIEGLENIQLESEEEYEQLLLEAVKRMTDEEREDLLVKTVKIYAAEEGIQINDFDDVIDCYYSKGWIDSNTKEAFYAVKEQIGEDNFYMRIWVYDLIDLDYNLIGEFNLETLELITYNIINPEGESKDYYLTTSNGDYTFIVEDKTTGKQYTKTVNVSNIINADELNYYVGNTGIGKINLISKNTNIPTTFEKIWMIYNDETLDITNLILEDEGNNYNFVGGWDIYSKTDFLYKDGGKEYTFIIEKDSIFYKGFASVDWPT